MLATFMNLEVQIEHVLDVGFAMLEDEPSLFHAQNAGTSTKRFHRCDDVTLPLNIDEDQGVYIYMYRRSIEFLELESIHI